MQYMKREQSEHYKTTLHSFVSFQLPNRGRRSGRPDRYLKPPLHAEDPLSEREVEWAGDLWVEERGVDCNGDYPYRCMDACMP